MQIHSTGIRFVENETRQTGRDLSWNRHTTNYNFRKTYFQIASNVADEILDQESLDNEIIEDKLKLAARRNRKRIRWSSELDALVAQTEDLNTCRWIIDQVFLMKDSIL